MQEKKTKVFHSFRLDPETLQKIKDLPKKDPMVFHSQARLVDAALFHFLSLPKTEQKKIIGEYLTKDL